MRNLLLLGVVMLGGAWAQDRPELNGVWQLDPGQSAFSEAKLKSQTLSIRQEDESIRLQETGVEENGKEKKLEIECNTNGKECALKLNGQAVRVSAYYNGAVLVVMELRRGSDSTIRRRLKTSEDGKTMTMEIANLGRPGQKPDSLVYAKQVSPK
jgi:hypothetical protein